MHRTRCGDTSLAWLGVAKESMMRSLERVKAGICYPPVRGTPYGRDSLPGDRLYCTKRVQIEPDVSSAALDEHLAALIGKEIVFCPATLGSAIAKRTDWTVTQVALYEGTLWIVDDERQLPAFALEALDGVATLAVFGELSLDPGIAPETIAARLAKVHNTGQISGTPQQLAAIEPLLGLRDGDLIDATAKEAPAKEPEQEEEEFEFRGSAGYLVL
jgi:hypothetical protein